MARLRDWLWEGGAPMTWRDVAVTLAAMGLPPLAGILLLGPVGAVAFVAALPAHLAAKDVGVPVAALVSLSVGMAGVLSLGDPAMALIVGPVLGAMAGLCGHFGFARPCLRALITWPVFTGPILPDDHPPLVLIVYILAMAWSLAVTRVFGQTFTTGEEDRESQEYAFVFAAFLAVGMLISVYLGRAFFGPHGFWFPLTFAVLCMPPHGELFRRTGKRTIGTILGTALAVGVAALAGPPWVDAAIGILALIVAFRLLPVSYTLFTALLTVAALEVLALVSSVDQLAVERLGTMAAAAAMTVILGLVAALALRALSPGAFRALTGR